MSFILRIREDDEEERENASRVEEHECDEPPRHRHPSGAPESDTLEHEFQKNDESQHRDHRREHLGSEVRLHHCRVVVIGLHERRGKEALFMTCRKLFYDASPLSY